VKYSTIFFGLAAGLVVPHNYRLQIISKTQTFSLAGEMYSMICVDMPFWSWFDVNRPTFDEDMREKTIFTFSFRGTLTFDF